jgi:acyl-CoA synthetase (AMP-forming)/AMP-acid ligase II
MGSLSNDDMGLRAPFSQPTKIVDHGKRLLPQALDKLATEDPEHTIGIIANPGTMPNLSFTSLTSSQMANAVNFTSHWLHELLDKDPYETIAFIGLQDFRYWIITLAAMKTGHTLLLASPRNAIVNNLSLLNAANCNRVLYSGGGSPLEVHVKELQSIISGLHIHEVPSLEQMIAVKSRLYPYNKTFQEAKKDTVLLQHTSGSTGHPKPIRINNAFLSRMDLDILAPRPPGTMLSGMTLLRRKQLNYLVAPLFHLSGLCAMAMTLFFENTTVLGPVDHIPSVEVACAMVKSLKLNSITSVPSFHQAIFGARGDELRIHLKDLDHICSFGGMLLNPTTWNKRLTDHFQDHYHNQQRLGSRRTFLKPSCGNVMAQPRTKLL